MFKPVLAAFALATTGASATDSFIPVIYEAANFVCPCDRAELLRQVAAQPELYPGEQLAIVSALADDLEIPAAETTKVLLTLLSNPSTYYGTKNKVVCLLPRLGLPEVQLLQVQAAAQL